MMQTSSIEQILQGKGSLLMIAHGNSMWPLLRSGKDPIYLKKPTGALRKHDIALFRRDNGQLVLHRIVAIEKDCCLVCGDAQSRRECIQTEQVKGVMCGFYRGKTYIGCDHLLYQIYTRLWCAAYPLRVGLLNLKFSTRKRS